MSFSCPSKAGVIMDFWEDLEIDVETEDKDNRQKDNFGVNLWKEIDCAKADGISVMVIMGSIVFVLVSLIDFDSFWLFIITSLVSLFFVMAYVGMPYSKKIEVWFLSSTNIYLRRLGVIFIRGLAWLIAVNVGLCGLKYWV